MEESTAKESGESDLTTDYALLRPPIEMSVSGAVQVYRCLQNGTSEVSDLLQYECDLIYECRVCRSMFRGLPNFISHKRVYCTKYHQDRLLEFVQSGAEDETVVVQPQAPEEKTPQPKALSEDKDKSAANKTVLNTLLDGSFEGVSAAYKFYSKAAEQDVKKKQEKKTTLVTLDPIKGNSNAVFQTVKMNKQAENATTQTKEKCPPASTSSSSVQNGSDCESTSSVSKHKGSALLEALCKNTGIVKPPIKEPIVTPTVLIAVDKKPVRKEEQVKVSTIAKNRPHQKTKWGNNPIPIAVKLAQRKDCNAKTLTCLKCNTQYSSRKTLHFHMISIHSEKRRFYPCIYCGTTFVQMWGVVRHVIRTHKKSRIEVDELREALRKKSFTRKVSASDSALKIRNISPKESKKVALRADGPKDKEMQIAQTSGSPTSSGKSTPRSPKVPPASEEKTTIQFTKNFTLHKCTLCGKAFARKELLDKHLTSCNKKGNKEDDDVASSVSTLSSRPKRVIRAKRSLYELEDEFASRRTVLAKKIKLDVEETKKKSLSKANKKTSTKKKEEADKNPKSYKPGQAYIDWKKVDQMVDKDQLQCKKCKAQYTSLYNVRRHVCQHMEWNRYKCKLCKFSAFHPCECRRHLSRAHPVAFKRCSDYHKLVVDLHKGNKSSKKQETKPKKKKVPTATLR